MPTSTEEAKMLLERVLREPFEFFEPSDEVFDFHVHRWFKYLIRESPCWTWQAHSFQFSALPTTYPLDLIVKSILRDDRPSEHGSREPDQLHLLGHLFGRRHGLAYGEVPPSVTIDLSVQPVLLGGPLSFHPADLHRFVPDAEPGEMAELNPYEDIGRELVWLIEARECARAAGDEEALSEANADLDSFLQETTAKLRQRRPPEGPGERILETLSTEGRRLFEPLWEAFPSEISERTDDLLDSLGVAEEERTLWAARLTLPILSKPEIEALQFEIEQSASWSRASGRPTPRRFTIFVLAHRLGMEPSTVARRAAGGSGGAYEEFQYAVNPIDAFLPERLASDRQ